MWKTNQSVVIFPVSRKLPFKSGIINSYIIRQPFYQARVRACSASCPKCLKPECCLFSNHVFPDNSSASLRQPLPASCSYLTLFLRFSQRYHDQLTVYYKSISLQFINLLGMAPMLHRKHSNHYRKRYQTLATINSKHRTSIVLGLTTKIIRHPAQLPPLHKEAQIQL